MITPLLLIIATLYPLLVQLALPRTRWIIIGLHVLLLFAIGMQQGILSGKEALKYTGCAYEVLHGDFHDITGNYVKYGAYVIFLLPFVAIGKAWLAVVAQVLIGILAADALARSTERITGNIGLGRLAMALFLLCPLIQTWTLALYTEHFFTCIIILFLERLDRHPCVDWITLLFAVIALFARPVGLFFVVPALLWKFTSRSAPSQRWGLITIGVLLVFAFALYVPRIAPAQLAPIASGQIIAGIGGMDAAAFNGRTIGDAQNHLINKVGAAQWLEITARRMLSLFTLTKPHFSTAHNTVNAFFYFLFPLALWGSVQWMKEPRVRLILLLLLTNALLVGLTHDEWSGRFLVPLLPWVMTLACIGLQKR
ncbi:MAG TPA: hypothetical protein PL070_17185 [Flavobacteriales bacterium]|nr:hypothetical protein [Flavobacteriales bacterium]